MIAASSSARIPAQLIAVPLQLVLVGVVLFLAAGTLQWWRAWVLLGVDAIGACAAVASLHRTSPSLLEERAKGFFKEGQSARDRVLLGLMSLLQLGMLIAIPVERFRMHIWASPPAWLSSVGLAMHVFGGWIAYLALRENAFASVVVRHQAERQQAVVDTGSYAIIRHPMYAGMMLLVAGIPLWLESYAGAILAAIAWLLLIVRIILEEQFLTTHLGGYASYVRRVRYRLVPHLW